MKCICKKTLKDFVVGNIYFYESENFAAIGYVYDYNNIWTCVYFDDIFRLDVYSVAKDFNLYFDDLIEARKEKLKKLQSQVCYHE